MLNIKAIFLFLMFFCFSIMSCNILEKMKEPEKEYYLRETVRANNITYTIMRVEARKRLGYYSPFYGNFLIIGLGVINNNRTIKPISSFKLIDQNGYGYDPTYKTGPLYEFDLSLKILTPGVEYIGVVVFDVPKNNIYKLVLFDPFASFKEITINLTERPQHTVLPKATNQEATKNSSKVVNKTTEYAAWVEKLKRGEQAKHKTNFGFLKSSAVVLSSRDMLLK